LFSTPTFFRNKRVEVEQDVQEALATVWEALMPFLPSGFHLSSGGAPRGIIGKPDKILVNSEKICLVIEIKPAWVLPTDDLVATFNQKVIERQDDITSPVCVFDALRQIFGYLSYNLLRFGVLTCYDKTWFMYRPLEKPSELRISSAIRHDRSHPTLLQCFMYIIKQALNDSYCPCAPSTPLLQQNRSADDNNDQSTDNDHQPSGDDNDASHEDVSNHSLGKRKRSDRSQNTRGNSKTARSHAVTTPLTDMSSKEENMAFDSDRIMYDRSSFDVLGLLGYGRSGTVLEAHLYGEKVALKICDLWQDPDLEDELQNEANIYCALEDLQGDCIPILKGAGCTDGGMFLIATEIAGEPIEPQSLTAEERQKIRKALKSIHHHGYVHNDIRKENILIRREGDRSSICFIDFAYSAKGTQEDFRKEMVQLRHVIGRP
jgi:tRNA A-37 threonylcarbamoyl transferase component Bud32